jgi:integrase
MYFDLGFRLSMPFHGVIEDNKFTVDAKYMKNHRTFKCLVNDEQKDTILMMQELYSKNPTRDARMWYSKKFSKVLKALGIENRWFHCIRHTFGVRRVIETGNLWQVRDEMAHESVNVTERYTRVFRTDLEADFPSLMKSTKVKDPKVNYGQGQANYRA